MKKWYKLLLPISILLFLGNQLIGQTNPFIVKNYSVREGLPGRLVLDITKDQSGLVWIATNKGLSRFDGYSFENFNIYDYSLAIENQSFKIDAVENDQEQLVVVHGQEALSLIVFDLNTFQATSPKEGIFPGTLEAVFTKEKGATYLVLSVDKRLILYQLLADFRLKELFDIPTTITEQNQNINLFIDNENNYWISLSKGGILLFNSAGQLQKKFIKEDFEAKINEKFETIFINQDSQNKIWLTTKEEKGVYQYNESKEFFDKIDLGHPNQTYSKMWEDEKGNLLFKAAPHLPTAITEGLVCLDKDNTLHSFNYLLTSTRHITDVYSEDFFKLILIGAPSGFIIANQNRPIIQNYVVDSVPSGSWGMIIRGIDGDGKGNLYFGAENGELFHLDKKEGIIKELPKKYRVNPNLDTYSGGRSIFLDKAQQNIWSTGNNSANISYLHRYNLASATTETTVIDGEFENFTYDGDELLYLLHTDHNGTDTKIMTFNIRTKAFKEWLGTKNRNPLNKRRTRAISTIQNDILWIGTTEGLFKINLKSQDFKRILLADVTAKLYDNQEVIAITQEGDKLWLGTNNGFVLWDIATEKIEAAYNDSDGLVSNSVCGILLDKEANLWLSTFDGLSYFNKKNKSFQNFYERDGLSHFEFNRMAFYKDAAQTFYFGSMNGVNAFDAEILLAEKAPKQLVPTKFTKNFVDSDSQQVIIGGLNKIAALIIEPNYGFFEYHFAMPNYGEGGARYSAWLENYELDWNFLGTNPKVRYSKLPAGNYQLKIKAVDAKGNPAQNQLTIPITIQEVFYKQTWFQCLLVLAFGLIAWSIAQYHAAQQLKVERLRTKLSSDLHDEVSGLLAGIAMQTDLMQMSIDDEKHKAKLDKIGTTSRSAMSKMGDVIWSVDARKDKFEDLLLRMQEHAAEILQPLGIDYQFEVGKFNVQKKLGLKLRQNLYLIFKESINNIAKHSNASKALISIQNKDNLFHLTIKDNGEAKPKNTLTKSGQGLSNLKMRTEEIQGKLTIYSKNGYEVHLKVRRFA